MFYQVLIHPASGGFGQWDVTRSDEGWADEGDLLQTIYGNRLYEAVYDLDQDELPDYVEDIRGRVRNEPARLLALVTTQNGDKTVQYVGIDEEYSEEEEVPMPYSTEIIDGQPVWFNARGEQVAHYPEMLLHGLLVRTLEQAEAAGRLTDDDASRLTDCLVSAWPMDCEDTPAQFSARSACLEAFRRAGLLP
jgi:hypothetical protein